MAVPPGNKQVGQLMVVVSYSAAANVTTSSCYKIDTAAVLTDTTLAAIPPSAPKNIMIGAVSANITYGAESNTRTITAYAINTLAILRYAPPTSINAEVLNTLALVSDPVSASRPLAQLKNVQIGQLAISVTHGVPYNWVQLFMYTINVIAVVRKFDPRHEHITMTIEYAASAKLNTGELV